MSAASSAGRKFRIDQKPAFSCYNLGHPERALGDAWNCGGQSLGDKGLYKRVSRPAARPPSKKEGLLSSFTEAQIGTLIQELKDYQKSKPKARGSEVVCVVCRENEKDDLLLLCDGCNTPFHTFCLTPSLKEVPKTKWFCLKCKCFKVKPRKCKSGEDGGFEYKDVVEARFDGGQRWYKGVITACYEDQTYDIRYDDGDEEEMVKMSFIRRIKQTPKTPQPPAFLSPRCTKCDDFPQYPGRTRCFHCLKKRFDSEYCQSINETGPRIGKQCSRRTSGKRCREHDEEHIDVMRDSDSEDEDEEDEEDEDEEEENAFFVPDHFSEGENYSSDEYEEEPPLKKRRT